MMIELVEDVRVRVPNVPDTWHTFKKGTFGNYSSEKSGPSHFVHRFVAQVPKHGFVTFTCVTLADEVPSWL